MLFSFVPFVPKAGNPRDNLISELMLESDRGTS